MKLSKLLLVVGCLFLAGCLSPIKNSHEHTYILNSLPCPIHAPHTDLTLLVTPPQTIQAYNTTQIAYTTCPHQLDYFTKNYWADTPPEMLMPLLVQTLQNTCHYHAIVTPPYNDYYDLVLHTQLIKLQQIFSEKPCKASHVSVILRAQLVQASNNHVIAERQFCVTEKAPCDNPYGGVVAANKAVAKLLEELAGFCVDRGTP